MNSRRKSWSKVPAARKSLFRNKILGLAVFVALVVIAISIYWPGETPIRPDEADIIIYRSSGCKCDAPWVRDLSKDGLAVSVITVRNLVSVQTKLDVPREFQACHTGVVGRYWVEGHVPASAMDRLIAEQPKDVRGVAYLRKRVQAESIVMPGQIDYEVVAYGANGEIR
jgi:hypothetical protein